jgi:hypothetical protein
MNHSLLAVVSIRNFDFLCNEPVDFMLLDLIDIVILISAGLSGAVIACCDVKYYKFPTFLLAILFCAGTAWCVKQSFIPISIVPLGIGMLALSLWNNLKRPVIGNGDMALFVIAGFFLTLDVISFFLICCGIFGIITHIIMGIVASQSRRLPFAPSILLSTAVTFLVTVLE